MARLESYGQHLGLGYQILDDLEEYLGLDQGKISQKTSITLPKIYASRKPRTTAIQMCIRAIADHCDQAKAALEGLQADDGIVLQLQEIVDEMTGRGLERCRSQKSLC